MCKDPQTENIYFCQWGQGRCQDHDVFATFQYVENTVSAISKHHDFQFNLQLYRSGLVNVTTCTGCHTKNMTSNKSFVETISEPHYFQCSKELHVYGNCEWWFTN